MNKTPCFPVSHRGSTTASWPRWRHCCSTYSTGSWDRARRCRAHTSGRRTPSARQWCAPSSATYTYLVIYIYIYI